jgi:pimeloyl-ACP methyl ester carboxylesterase
MPIDFHRRAAVETVSFLEAIGVERAVLWGHSDGAVIAAIIGLNEPRRCLALILEAFHYDRAKPASRDFFRAMMLDPSLLGERVCSIMVREHGEDYWRKVLSNNGEAWLRIGEKGNRPDSDFYEGRLNELRAPTLLIHGSGDPRTEPDELAIVQSQLRSARVHIIEGATHSPHSSRRYADECARVAKEFLETLFQPATNGESEQ